MILEPRPRPLRQDERERLKAERDELLARRGALEHRMAVVLVSVILVLWLLTLLASDAPAMYVSLFWLAFGGLLWAWLRRDLNRQAGHARALAGSLDEALRRGEAESYDIVARASVEFEEFEDEGACLAFDMGDGKVVFVRGQQYYREEDFPSLDFSIVHVHDESGRPVFEWLEKRGSGEPPARTVPAERTWALGDVLPGHLTVIRADIRHLEQALEADGRAMSTR